MSVKTPRPMAKHPCDDCPWKYPGPRECEECDIYVQSTGGIISG